MTHTPPSSLQLLGTFQLVHHAKVVQLGQARLEELVTLLALYPGEPFTRSQIAYLFWPDSNEQQARTNVRNLLYKLKQAWPDLDDTITLDRRFIMWRATADMVVDVQRFKKLLARAEESKASSGRVHLLAEAAAELQGDLLPDCYSDWILPEREQLRSHYAAVMEAWIGELLELRRYDEALVQAQRLRDHDPLRESTYRRLMQIHALLGDRAAALHVYQSCASILHRELGVEPAPATRQLRDQLTQQTPVAEEAPATHQALPHQVLQRPRMTGRHAEWQRLLEVWRAVQKGSARCVIIWGEAGIGKTRLAEELIDWVRHHGHSWASSRSYATQGALVYAPVTEWLRAPAIRPALATIADLWRIEIARLLPEVLANRPELPAPGPLQETWQRQRFYEGILHTLQALPGPLLLHLDDMQWSDQETLHFVHFLLHNTRQYPLLLVGAIRSEENANNAALEPLLEALRHSGQLIEVHLEPLSQAETTELAELAAGTPISTERAAALFASSEGHPLFLIESLRGAIEEIATLETNQATASPDLASPDLPTPGTIPTKIYQLIAARLRHLSPAAQKVIAAAAVIGRRFTYRVLHESLTLDELALVDALDELWTRRIVREQPDAAPDFSYDFSHDRIREVCYQEISHARRRLLHRQVATALETIHAGKLDPIAGDLAAHFAQAGDRAQAFHYYRQAATLAWTHFAEAQAEAMFDAALAFAPDDPALRIEILYEQNRLFRLVLNVARWQANIEQQGQLLASLSVPSPRLLILASLDRSEYLRISGSAHDAVAAAQVAIRAAESVGDSAALAKAYQEVGDALWYLARMAEAGEAFAQSAHHARAAGDHALEAQSLESQAATGMFSGMLAQPLFALTQRAFDVAEVAGDKRRMSSVANKLGYSRLAHGMGDFDRIEQDFQRALLLSREIGAREDEETVLANLCVLFTAKGDYRQALDAYQASTAVGQRRRAWRDAMTHGYFGALMMQMGDLAAARTELTNASEELHRLGSRHFEVKARCDLGLLYHLTGEDALAREELTQVLGLIQGYGDLRFEALVSTRLAYALEASQMADDAQPLYERGQLLHEQMGQHYYALNARAGLARLAAQQGDDAAALAHAQAIWETLRGRSTDATVETARTLRTCYTLLQRHGFHRQRDPQATEILDTAYTQLCRRAATLDNPQTKTLFWQLPDHRFLQEAAR